MSFEDKQLTCADCGANFTFSADEQEFFQTKGYTNEPKRCPTCRQARKSDRNSRTGEVPFEPRSDRPVYCSDCYNKVRASK
jgi:CxxC-x17-CxxC domain-containing protein